MKDYSTYKCADFASDQVFIDWVKHPDHESDAFWTSLMATNQSLGKEMEEARLIVQSMRFVEKELPEQDVQALWYSIINHTRRNHVIRHYWRMAAACAASVAIIFGVWKWLENDAGKQHDALVEFAASHSAQVTESNDVQIVLSDDTNYAIANSHVEIQYDEKGQLTVDTREIVEQPAQTSQKETARFNQVMVPWGKRTVISFADGTKLWLNAGSRAVYPVEFTGNSREIFIEGEAYFEVAKDENKPFIVKTGLVEVKVLGTKFNVNAYPQEGKTEVALVSGSVQVVSRHQKETQLQPDHLVEIDHATGQQAVKQVDAYNYVCWKEGFLLFHSEHLDVILRKLERHYAVPVVIETPLDGYTISGKLDLKENITGTLDIIKRLAPVQYQFKDNRVFIRKE